MRFLNARICQKKLIGLGFTQDQLRLNTLVYVILSEKKRNKIAIAKSKNIIHKLVANKPHLIFKEKTASQTSIALEIRFQQISLINISWILYNAPAKKIADFNDVIKYKSSYQVPSDKMTSMLRKDFNLTIKIEEILLQGVILMNISEKYTSFISTIKKKTDRRNKKSIKQNLSNHQTFGDHENKCESENSHSKRHPKSFKKKLYQLWMHEKRLDYPLYWLSFNLTFGPPSQIYSLAN